MENINQTPSQPNQSGSNPEKSNTPQAIPDIAESEMKLPEEHFGGSPEPEKTSTHVVSPMLVIALVVVLIMLGGAVIWSDELIGLLLPESANEQVEGNTDGESMMDAEAVTTEDTVTEEDLAEIEAALEASSDFDSIDSEFEAIEAEMEANQQ